MSAVDEMAVVPDFSGERAELFEARTLFFLASWLEQNGGSGSRKAAPRLLLCCIGEPPGSVCLLAGHAGAEVTVHTPLAGFWGGLANKLRGLEGAAPGTRRLLVDVDVLVLGGLELLSPVQADFAAAVAGKPQVPQAAWELIYAALDLPLPTERVASLRGRLGLGLETIFQRYEGQQEEARAMLPYYNSGVLLVRGGGGLRERWEDHLHRVLRLTTERPEMAPIHAVVYNDQVGLATALEALRAGGRTFALLPDACNARLAHLRAAALRWRDIRLFHATGFLRGLRGRTDLPTLLEQDAARWSEAILEGASRDPAAARDVDEPRRFVFGLWERWVRAAWERG